MSEVVILLGDTTEHGGKVITVIEIDLQWCAYYGKK